MFFCLWLSLPLIFSSDLIDFMKTFKSEKILKMGMVFVWSTKAVQIRKKGIFIWQLFQNAPYVFCLWFSLPVFFDQIHLWNFEMKSNYLGGHNFETTKWLKFPTNVSGEKLTIMAIAGSSKSHIFSGSLLLSYNPRNPVAV